MTLSFSNILFVCFILLHGEVMQRQTKASKVNVLMDCVLLPSTGSLWFFDDEFQTCKLTNAFKMPLLKNEKKHTQKHKWSHYLVSDIKQPMRSLFLPAIELLDSLCSPRSALKVQSLYCHLLTTPCSLKPLLPSSSWELSERGSIHPNY